MKTKSIPALIMLTAGLFTCIMGITQHMDTTLFMKMLLGVLIAFYILGCVIQLILDKNFKPIEEPKESEDTQESEELEGQQDAAGEQGSSDSNGEQKLE